jgi:copper chaperone CopZ
MIEVKPENGEVEKSRRTNLGTLGARLPIFDGCETPTFSFKEWDMDIEETLSDLQEQSANVGTFVRSMMDLLLDEFKGKDYQSLSKEEKLITLSQLHFPNMMYMYMVLRVEELGHELHFDSVQCPHCKKKIENFVADLRGLDVECKDKEHEQTVKYELKKPITMPGINGAPAKVVTGLLLSVSKWDALESVPTEKAANAGYVKKAIFNSAITGCTNNGELVEGYVDLKSLVKKIKKFDIERIGKEIVNNNAGPDMKISGNCQFCKKDFETQINWGYESFFDSSSL